MVVWSVQLLSSLLSTRVERAAGAQKYRKSKQGNPDWSE